MIFLNSLSFNLEWGCRKNRNQYNLGILESKADSGKWNIQGLSWHLF